MIPKKSLGQNFLRDKKILEKIIEAAEIKPGDFVIEVGPGEGALTNELAKRAEKIICIEKDERLADNLASNFQFSIFNFQSISNGQILNFQNKTAVIKGDILEINLPELIELNFLKAISYKLKAGHYKVVANIPYYITSPIIQLFLETKYPPQEMILMVQKEVAERICARPGQMSILAVSVQYYARPELLFYVPRTAFYPAPDVDSAVIKITFNRQPTTDNEAGTKNFFRTVKAGFSSKRKTLLNNLSSSFHLEKEETAGKIRKAGLEPTQRAQELSVEDWKRLTERF